MRYFAYLTKEQDLHYCHVFMVDSLVSARIYLYTGSYTKDSCITGAGQ